MREFYFYRCCVFWLLLHLAQGVFAEETSKGSESLLIPYGYYTPETSLAVGAFHVKPLAPSSSSGKTSMVRTNLTYTLKNQFIGSIGPRFYFFKERGELLSTLSYKDYPNRYYGIGAKTDAELKETYKEQALFARISYAHRLFLHFHGGVGMDFHQRTVRDIEVGGLLESDLQGGLDQYQLPGYHLQSFWDDRDHVFSPRRGGVYRYLYSRYPGDFDFEIHTVDLRKYVSLKKNHVLALQLYSSWIYGEKVPTHFLRKIGGSKLLRGFFKGRYQDRSMRAVQVEYRRPLTQRWDLNFYGGAGEVAARPEGLNGEVIRSSYGVGVRYVLMQKSQMKARIDFGVAEGKPAFYLVVDETF